VSTNWKIERNIKEKLNRVIKCNGVIKIDEENSSKKMSTETPRPVHAGFRMKPPGKAGCPLLTLLTLLTCYQSYHELHLIPSTESIGVFDEESIGLAIHAQQRVGGCS
jgi:hypothetical protein